MTKKQFRDTRQRNAIKRSFETAARPLGPKEVLALATTEVPNLGIATVYRNIKSMVDKKELEVVDLPGQAPRYQLPMSGDKHLFMDTKTDAVFTIQPDLGDFKPQLPEEYRLHRFQLICYGEVVGRKLPKKLKK
ncbi:MAG: transcriptional repressor [Verrucomicrobiota bacterium]|nr:transcriptional repressor [Verrucomicrobiota bacterium]